MADYSFILNEVDYGDSSHLLTVVGHSIDHDFHLNVEDLAQDDGFVSQGTKLGRSIFNLDCVVAASSPSTRDTAFGNVIGHLREAHIAGLTTFDPYFIDATTELDARPYGGISDLQYSITGASFSIKLIAVQPVPE